MPDPKDAPASAVLPQPTQTDEALTLEQWAATQSASDRRVELLNAFVSVQRAEGNFTALPAEWAQLYAAFAARPV